jgi:hypothetical protein
MQRAAVVVQKVLEMVALAVKIVAYLIIFLHPTNDLFSFQLFLNIDSLNKNSPVE